MKPEKADIKINLTINLAGDNTGLSKNLQSIYLFLRYFNSF